MSAQTMADVHAPIEAHYKSIVMHQTWGHLFPTGLYYEGYVRIANATYGNCEPIDEQIDISSSPWWYDAITDFVFNVQKDMPVGEVADFYIGVSVVKEYDYPDYWDEMDEDEREDWGPVDTYETLNIRQIKKTIIAKGY
jgi:hypothetical protein